MGPPKGNTQASSSSKQKKYRQLIYVLLTWMISTVLIMHVVVGFHRSDYLLYMRELGHEVQHHTDMTEVDSAHGAAFSVRDQSPLPAQAGQPLNIVIFYPDDWRHDDLGDIKPYIHTPFLSQMASRGIRFTLNAVTTSICWISRATFFSGQYFSRHGSNILNVPRFAMPKSWKFSWPYLLQKYGGYYVGHIGKWQFMHVYDDYLGDEELFNFSRYFEGNHFDKRTGLRNTFQVESAFEAFMEQRPKDSPFAVTLAYYPPKAVGEERDPGAQWKFVDEKIKNQFYNESVVIPDPYPDMTMEEAYERIAEPVRASELSIGKGRWTQRWSSPEHYQEGMKNYYSLITEVDKSCSRIYTMIEKEGLVDSTMFLFVTDNGLFHGAHGLAGKWWPYQESIRVPLIIQDPRMDENKRGTVDDTSMVLNIDLASTILSAAGLDIEQADGRFQGRDIAESYLGEGKSFDRDNWYYEFTTDHAGGSTATALVGRRYKYIFWRRIQYEQLFDVQEDPLEMNDLRNSSGHQSILELMRVRHDELRADVLEPCIPDASCDVSSEAFNHTDFIGIFHSEDTKFRHKPL